MSLVLDSRQLPGTQRADALNAAMSNSEVPHTVTLEGETGESWHRLDFWDLGGGAHVLRQVGTAMRIVRGPRHLRIAAPERVAVGLQIRSHGFCLSAGVELAVPQSELHIVDQTGPYDYSWGGVGGSKAVMVDCDRLGIPVDVVRAAAPQLRSSPVYDLFRAHLSGLGKLDVNLPAEPARLMLSAATVELLRALIVTAAHDDRLERDVLRDTFHGRVTQYLRQHLRDPDLNAASVAAAHHVSVRQLYKLWPPSELSLSDWLMSERLEKAKRQLADPRSRDATVASVARHWGFADATHFARRFRAAYGLSPTEWRASQR